MSKKTVLARGVDADLWKAFKERAVNENGGDLWAAIGPALNRAISNYLRQACTHTPIRVSAEKELKGIDLLKYRLLHLPWTGTKKVIAKRDLEDFIMKSDNVMDKRAVDMRVNRLLADAFIIQDFSKIDSPNFIVIGDLEVHLPGATQI